MHDDTLSLSPAYRYQVEHRVCGEVHVHFHVHFDHAALAAKLREATSDLKAAVDANQPSPPVPTS